MKYYLNTIEQIKGEEEGAYNEYSGTTKYADEKTATTKFYEKLMNVSNSEVHTWLDIKIVNSEGGVVKKDCIGNYVETE